MLRTAPSFSIYNSIDGVEGEEKKIEEQLERDGLKLGERVGSTGSFTFDKSVASGMSLIEERDDEEEGMRENGDVGIDSRMFPATGGGFVPPEFDDVAGCEAYYKKMVDENPSSALFLGNYARILESKGDLEGAEEYYFRAAFVDPNDGKILILYANLVWRLYRDRNRAQDYFERAILVCPPDSDVLAAYARFMWEIEEEKVEYFQENDQNKVEEDKIYVSNGGIDDTFGENTSDGADTEEYYKRIVDENPKNSIVLRNYAHYLYKTKEDVKAAEDTYARAILADPTNGETKSEYAQLIWEAHNDRHRALFCFEQALLASPEDGNILAAYARFLWEAGEDEEDNA